MNNLFNLVKVDFLGSFSTKNNKNKTKSTSFKFILCGVVLFGLFLSTLYNLLFTTMFKEAGVSLVYSMLIFTGFTSLLTITTSVFKVKSIFTGTDYDMLRAMPIRKSEIIASKIISLYLVELLYSAIILLPNTIIILVLSKSFIYLFTGILAILLTPAIPMMVACLIAMFISLIADRYKFGNFISVVFYLVFFAALMSFSFIVGFGGSSDSEEQVIQTYINMSNVFKWFNPTNYFLELTINVNFLFVFVYIVVNALFIVGVILFISIFYDKVHDIITSFRSDEIYVRKVLKTEGLRKTLLMNEFRRFFSSKYYFINCSSSGILALVFAVLGGLSLAPWSPIRTMPEEISEFITPYGYFLFLIIAFSIGISTPASIGISIEGGNFWLIKSTPIDYKELIRAKLLLSIIVLGPFAVVSSLILTIFAGVSVFSIVLAPILSLVYVILAAVIGLDINLSYYKLKWKNEMEIVKNSTAVVLSLFADWGVTIIVAASSIGLSFVNTYLAGFAQLGVMLVWITIQYRHLIKSCTSRINKIEDF